MLQRNDDLFVAFLLFYGRIVCCTGNFCCFCLDTKGPVFATPNIIYAFKGQVNNHQVNALGFQNKPVINYRLIDESPEMSITNQGLISWTPVEANQTYVVTIQAIDICGAMTTKQFTFETRKCPCEKENDGYCKWKMPSDSHEIECVCPDGCTGKR